MAGRTKHPDLVARDSTESVLQGGRMQAFGGAGASVKNLKKRGVGTKRKVYWRCERLRNLHASGRQPRKEELN